MIHIKSVYTPRGIAASLQAVAEGESSAVTSSHENHEQLACIHREVLHLNVCSCFIDFADVGAAWYRLWCFCNLAL